MNNMIERIYMEQQESIELGRARQKDSQKPVKEATELECWLMAHLEGACKEKFAAFIEADCEMDAMMEKASFREGFRLGARIIMEVLANE